MAELRIVNTRTLNTYTVAILSDGREIGARNSGDRWTGKMVDVRFIDTAQSRWGDHITLRMGTSHPLALNEAVTKLNSPSRKPRAIRPRPVAEVVIPEHPVKQLVNGEGFLWLGTSHRLLIVESGEPIGFFEPWRPQCWLHLRRDAAEVDTIIGWYAVKGSAYAAELVTKWAPRIGVRDVQVRVAALPGKWARHHGKTIILHWAIFQLPKQLVEYLIVHRLACIAATTQVERRRLMRRCLLDWEDRERDWKKQESSVWLGDIHE